MTIICELTPVQIIEQLLSAPPPRPAHPCSLDDLLVGKKVVVYGCGDGLITFSVFVLEKYGIQPVMYLDRKFETPTLIDEIIAISPDHYHPDPAVCIEAVVVITVGKTRFHQEIIAQLRSIGFVNIILASDIYEYHLSHASKGFEKLGFPYFQQNSIEIRKAFDLMADEKSQSVYVQVLHTHIARMPIPITHDALKYQYFPQDVPLHKGFSRTVNCGSYNGDTLRQLHFFHGKIDELVCFEPDLRNFSELLEYIEGQNGQLAHRISAFPCGVFSSDIQLRFSGGNRINSSISSDGDLVVQCVSLDHAIPDFHPTFINMDIEGAEPEALKGASRMIQHDQPDLAICVYHRPQHLWEIPNYLHSLNPDYRLYLRNYTGFPAETVAYATI